MTEALIQDQLPVPCEVPGCQDPFAEWWRPAPGFEDVYAVNSHGPVRRTGRAARNGKGHGGGARIGRILKPQDNGHGYLMVQLWRDGRPKMVLVHVLVARAFPNEFPDEPSADMEVNHKDGVKANVCYANLEHVTHAENGRHAYRTGLRTVSEAQLKQLQSKHKVRQPRQIVACGCGCGAEFETPDSHGWPRRFVRGHRAKLGRSR